MTKNDLLKHLYTEQFKQDEMQDAMRRARLIPLVIAIVVTLIIVVCILCGEAKAQDYTNEQIVNAIYLTEGGAKAKVPYGILSVKVSSTEEARRVCYNTVRNNRKRFLKQAKYDDFLEFLASRYAPIGASNDPRGLNRNWLKNLKYFLERGC